MPKGSGKEKKVLFLMAGPLRTKPPSLELDGRLNVGTLKKRFQWPSLSPPTPLNGPAKKQNKIHKKHNCFFSGQANMGVGKPPWATLAKHTFLFVEIVSCHKGCSEM